MRVALRKMGNSSGVILSKPMLAQIGAVGAEEIEMSVEGDRVVIAAVSRHPREGWAEASKALAASGDDGIDDDWINAPTNFDDEWEW